MSSPDKMTVLRALWDAELDGLIGTPKERLQALARKAECDRHLERFKALSLHQMSNAIRRLAAGETPDEILETP